MIDCFPLPKGTNASGLGGWPITSPYGPRWGRLHGGIDLSVPQGTPLYAVTSGRIYQSWDPGGGGNWTRLVGDDGNVYGYGHQSAFIPDPDGHVDAGQRIGYVGNTGTSSGPHLHFAWAPGGGAYRDPYQILADAASRGAFADTPIPSPPITGDWLDMATKAEVEQVVRAVVQQEISNQDARMKATIGAQLDAVVRQLAPVTLDPPVLRQLVERIINKTGA